MLIAEQNKDEKGFELMLLWEHITICARMHKQEFNIADTEEEETVAAYEDEVIIDIQEKRQEIIMETFKTRKIKTTELKNNEDQLKLF